ncbi:MAG TPA: hypothetical protein VK513_17655 [Terriglobales bacterium]|nr:hypothetical protein [Terriglobales bacterium]
MNSRGNSDLGAHIAEITDQNGTSGSPIVRPNRRVSAGESRTTPNRDSIGEIKAMFGRDHGTITQAKHRLGRIYAIVIGYGIDHIETEQLAIVAQVDALASPKNVARTDAYMGADADMSTSQQDNTVRD